MNRRSLLLGIGSVLAAPAIVRAGNLMPIKAWKPDPDYYVLDGTYWAPGYDDAGQYAVMVAKRILFLQDRLKVGARDV